MNTQLQLAVNFIDASDIELRDIERIAIIARAVETVMSTHTTPRRKKVWRTMPDHFYNLSGTGTGEEPHDCSNRSDANGM